MPWVNLMATSLVYMYISQSVAQALSSICSLLLPRHLTDAAVAMRMAAVGAVLLSFKALSLAST